MCAEELQILYQDDRYVAVHKPAGMLVHRTAIDRHETRFCLQVLRQQLGCHVYPCHRLDKPTSGVLLFALDKEALRAGFSLFSGKETRKTYHALARGWMDERGCVDHPLRNLKNDTGSKKTGEFQDAVTEWRLLRKFEIEVAIGRYPTARYSLVELRPQTGRMHQLRRHMKHLHHHIIGDTRYGDGLHNRFFRDRFACHRLMLQASHLEFAHPFTSSQVAISAGPDPSFSQVMDQLDEAAM